MKSEGRALVALVIGTVLFGAAIAFRDVFDPWWGNAAAAAVALLLSIAALRGRLRALLALRLGPTLVAVLLGVLMVIGTHAIFALVTRFFPELGSRVGELYGEIRETSPGLGLKVLLIIAIAATEEILWRGVAYEWCRNRWSTGPAALATVILYALPQLIGGSWVLIAAAVAAGAVFTAERIWSDRLGSPIVTHAIWSVSIFALFPLR